MRLLLDACVWRGSATELQNMGHDVLFAEDIVPGLPDKAILERAYEEGRILVTLDKDFGALSERDFQPHRGIVRLVEVPYRHHALVIGNAVELYAQQLLAGGIVVVKGPKVRLRMPKD